jgi:acetyl-CoA acetyltransferase
MREVVVLGVGMTPFQRNTKHTFATMGREAIFKAIEDAQVNPGKVEAGYCGTVFGGSMSGQKIFKETGLTGMPVINVENACSSGSTAFREAWLAVASGLHDMVIVVGAEKLSDLGKGPLPLQMEDVEASQGMVMPALYAMRAKRYQVDNGATDEDLALVAVKNRKNGSLNPYAQFRKEVTVDEVVSSRMVANPLTLYQSCPTGDGASAVIICDSKTAKKYTTKPIKLLATTLSSGKFMNGFRDMTSPEITLRCSKKAYEASGCEPKDIDVAEVHDAFTIAEILYYEALGFCEKGEGVQFLREGKTSLDGSIPVNPSGGLISRGHPLGATGLAQITEVVWQLRGEAGNRQIKGANIGLTHCTGGGIWGFDHGACSISILGR